MINLSIDSEHGIATLTINNFHPVVLMKGLQQTNTLNSDVLADISKELNNIRKSDFIKTVVFTGIYPNGSYPVFCDGMDLTVLSGLRFLDFGDDMRREVENHRYGINIINEIADMEQYFIARLNGHCIGGGLEFALSCDYLIALPKILVGMPESKYGILPGWNGLQTLAYKIGKEKTLTLYFEGFFEPSGKNPLRNGICGAEEALELGIIDEIAPSQITLDERVREIAEEFSNGQRKRRPKPELTAYKVIP